MVAVVEALRARMEQEREKRELRELEALAAWLLQLFNAGARCR